MKLWKYNIYFMFLLLHLFCVSFFYSYFYFVCLSALWLLCFVTSVFCLFYFFFFFRFCVCAFFLCCFIVFLLLPMMKRKRGLFIIFTFLTNNIITITNKQRHTFNRIRKQRFHTYTNYVPQNKLFFTIILCLFQITLLNKEEGS